MKSENTIGLKSIDSILDPRNALQEVLKKVSPRLALDITPTVKHDPCHDLFRIYTFKLLKNLSKKFEIILIYRDLQATVDLSLEESRRLIEDNISLVRGAGIPFVVHYESEILRNFLVNMPEKFFRYLYKSVLRKEHNHMNKHIMFSSTSLAILFPLLELLKIDVLLCMDEERENIKILNEILKGSDYFPVIFYRSLRDLKNKVHSPSDRIREFPRVDWDGEKLYNTLLASRTDLKTLQEWYKKLDMDIDPVFKVEGIKGKKSFNELVGMIRSNLFPKKELFWRVSSHLAEFLANEGKFLDIASKELKVSLEDKNHKVFTSLSSTSRIKIIKLLNKGDFGAYQIAKEIDISLPTTLFHLNKLQEAGMLEKRNRLYHLKTNRVVLYA